MANRSRQFSSVERIKMKIMYPLIDQPAALLYGDPARYQATGVGIVVEPVKQACQPVWQRGAAARAKIDEALIVSYR